MRLVCLSGFTLSFLLTPLREGRPAANYTKLTIRFISTHAPAGGATKLWPNASTRPEISTHAPAGGATGAIEGRSEICNISTHAPAGGATELTSEESASELFLLTPLREGRLERIRDAGRENIYFYSRPCGRGDAH